jgi:hypothetical protein
MTLSRDLFLDETPQPDSGFSRSLSGHRSFAPASVLGHTLLNPYCRATALAASACTRSKDSGTLVTGKTPFNTQ